MGIEHNIITSVPIGYTSANPSGITGVMLNHFDNHYYITCTPQTKPSAKYSKRNVQAIEVVHVYFTFSVFLIVQSFYFYKTISSKHLKNCEYTNQLS